MILKIQENAVVNWGKLCIAEMCLCFYLKKIITKQMTKEQKMLWFFIMLLKDKTKKKKKAQKSQMSQLHLKKKWPKW